MLFGGCNCGPGSLVSAYGSLCAGGAGFVSAMIGAMVANARTANAPELGREVTELDRLAVRMVTDNIVIQFVPPETRYGVTIERRVGGNLTHESAAAHRAQRRMGIVDARAIASQRRRAQRAGRFRLYPRSAAQ